MIENIYPWFAVLVGVIYFLKRLFSQREKMSKHDTLNAVGMIVLIYLGIGALFIMFPISWFVKFILLGFFALFFTFTGIVYFIKKQDITVNKEKLDLLLNYFLGSILTGALVGYGGASLFLKPTDFLPIALSFGIAVIIFIMIWLRVKRKAKQD